MFDILFSNLFSPMILCFVLGICAKLLRSDLKIPPDLYTALTLYLLLAIGLKGGVEISEADFQTFIAPAGATLALGVATPLIVFALLRLSKKISRVNAAALAAHYGSVSAVTFIAASQFASAMGQEAEGFMPALLALLECPGIFVAIMLGLQEDTKSPRQPVSSHLGQLLRSILTGKSMMMLVGGLFIGVIVGREGYLPVKPFFQENFKGVLCLFLMELGLLTASNFRSWKTNRLFLILFATLVPLMLGSMGVWLGVLAGLGQGGSLVLGAMAASASYIAAPPAIRSALPDADIALCLTAALVITFPFNLIIGIPIYFKLAQLLS